MKMNGPFKILKICIVSGTLIFTDSISFKPLSMFEVVNSISGGDTSGGGTSDGGKSGDGKSDVGGSGTGDSTCITGSSGSFGNNS